VSAPEPRMDPAFPMGAVLTHFPERRSWLHETLKIFFSAKIVLVFPTCCCGSYNEPFTTLLRQTFPQVEWIFPQVGDLNGRLWACQQTTNILARHLISQGILREGGEQGKQEAPS